MKDRWPVRPLRALAEVDLGRQRSPDRDQGPNMVQYLRAANVKDGSLDLGDVKFMDFSPSEQRAFRLQPGDVVVTEGAGSLAAVGASAAWSGEIHGVVCFQNTLLRLRPRSGNDPRYLMWWARHAHGSGLFASIAGGANIYHLGAERVRLLPCAMPDPKAQRAIADYLDAETARIGALVLARRRSLDLMREHFESAVWSTTTRGLRQTGLRDSGIPWAGLIPADWETPAVGHLFEVQLGKMLNPEAAAPGQQYVYLRNENVQWDRIDLDDLNRMQFDATDRARYGLRPGDLLVCEGGDVGRAAMWRGELTECYYQKALHRVRARRPANVRFLMYVLRAAAGRGVFENEGNTSTFVHLTAEKFRAHRFPCPSIDEQHRIVDHLDREAAALAAAESALSRQVDLLLERRQTLITAAVTGQLEIPGVAA